VPPLRASGQTSTVSNRQNFPPPLWLRRLRDCGGLAAALLGPAWPDPTAADAEAFGEALAGLVDGEGSGGVDHRGYGQLVLTMHRSEASLLAAVQGRLGGGSLFPAAGSKGYRLRLTDRSTLQRLLAAVGSHCRHPVRCRQLAALAAALRRLPQRQSSSPAASAAAAPPPALRDLCPRVRRWKGPSGTGWLALLFAADGYLYLDRRRSHYPALRLSVSSSHPSVVLHCHRIFGAGSITQQAAGRSAFRSGALYT
jgi:hypothetical protein